MESLCEREREFFEAQRRIMIMEASDVYESAPCGQLMPDKTKKAYSEASAKFTRYNPPLFQRSQLRIIA